MRQLTLFSALWQQLCSLDNLYVAYQKAKKGKSTRNDVALFSFNLEEELSNLHVELKNQRYQPSGYRQFFIYERKPRMISVAPFRDRVIHHALMNIVEPIIDKVLVDETFACRKGKGVHAAANYYQQQCTRYQYVLKMDVKRYFPSVCHKILKRQCREVIKDDYTIRLMDAIIDSNGSTLGLPIGNLTSQVLANLYLNNVDHFVLRQNNIKYLRYVDDIFVLGNCKKTLWRLHQLIVAKLADLKLQLHPKQTEIYQTSEKVDVLGYKITKDKRWLRNENGYRFRRKLVGFTQHYKAGTKKFNEFNSNVQSWIGHACHAETYGLRKKLFNEAVFQKGEEKPKDAPAWEPGPDNKKRE